jgi:hypothetical protein
MLDILGHLQLIPKSIIMSWRSCVPLTICHSRMGHAMALADSCWLLSVGLQVCSQCGIYGGQSVIGLCFSQGVLFFLLLCSFIITWSNSGPASSCSSVGTVCPFATGLAGADLGAGRREETPSFWPRSPCARFAAAALASFHLLQPR